MMIRVGYPKGGLLRMDQKRMELLGIDVSKGGLSPPHT